MIIEQILINELGLSKLTAEKLEEMILEGLADQCPNWDSCVDQFREAQQNGP